MSAAVIGFAYEEPGKLPSAALALLVHVLLAVFLFFGVHWQSRQPEAVTVELWNSPPPPAAPKIEHKAEVTPAPVPEPKPAPKPEVVPEPKIEKTVEPVKPDIALEKKIKKELPKKAEPKPVKKPEPKPKLDRSKDILAQAERESAALSQQLEKNRILEQMKREAAAYTAKANTAYANAIHDKIRSKIVQPRDIIGNPEAIFEVVQLPTGDVMSVKLRKSSGFAAFDAAVERAIYKASPLPRPDRPELFQRELVITYKPHN